METNKLKKCSTCKIDKTLDSFGKNRAKRDGLNYKCKACYKKHYQENREKAIERAKKYQQENREKVLEYTKKRYQDNREKALEYGKKHYQENKEKIAERTKKRYQDNREKALEYKKKYQQENKEKISEYAKKHAKNNRSLYNAHAGKRRAAKLNATPKWSEIDKIKLVYEKAKWLESITGKKYHVDHIVPLQGKDVCGLHVWHNLQILEDTINFSKNNKY